MAVWTIAGETGKAWNATAQTLEFRAVEAGTLAFRSLEADTLTLQVVPSNFKTYTMPELGQIVRLYRNGTLFFTGHVTDTPVSVTVGAQSIAIVVSGPWWWMERINYTSTQTDGTGATGARMTGVFGDAPSVNVTRSPIYHSSASYRLTDVIPNDVGVVSGARY